MLTLVEHPGSAGVVLGGMGSIPVCGVTPHTATIFVIGPAYGG